MKVHTLFIKYLLKTVLFFFFCIEVKAQPITGIWKGKLGNSRVELKLILHLLFMLHFLFFP